MIERYDRWFKHKVDSETESDDNDNKSDHAKYLSKKTDMELSILKMAHKTKNLTGKYFYQITCR